MNKHLLLRAAMLACVVAQPARAEWLKASSTHFTVYADADRKALLKQASELERFDAVLRRYPRVTAADVGAFNPVTVYVVPDAVAVQKLLHRDDVAGFYVPRVTGSVAFTPRE